MPYVFANPGRSGGAATASFAVRAVGAPRSRRRLPLVVDLENDPYKKGTDCYGVGVPAMIAWIAGFTGRASALTGKWPTIYTTADWWRECTGSTSRFRHDPLWLAAFGGTAPTVPSPGRTGRSGSTTTPARCRDRPDTTWTTTSRPTAFPRSAGARRGGGAQARGPKSARRRRRPSGTCQEHGPRASTRSRRRLRHQPKPKKHKAHHQSGVCRGIRGNADQRNGARRPMTWARESARDREIPVTGAFAIRPVPGRYG